MAKPAQFLFGSCHQSLRHDFAFNDVVLKLLHSPLVEIGMGIGVVPQRHPSVEPLLQQRDARVTFTGRLQFTFVEKSDGGRSMFSRHSGN